MSAITMSALDDNGRPPLAPVGLSRRRLASMPNHAVVEKNEHSQQAEGNHSEDVENSFDLMHVTIVIYGLSGILCRKMDKKKRRLHSPTFTSVNSNNKGSPVSKKSEGTSTISSKEVSGGEEIFFMQVPTTAIVVFERKTLSSQTSLLSYLPSLPLGIPTHASLHSSRYSASWPAELHSSYAYEECSAMDRSSFTFTRVMKRETFARGKSCSASTYVPETIDLLVHLGRGTEMITLGTTSLVITGDEEAEVQLNLPVKQFQYKSKRSRKTLTACRRKPSFAGDSLNVFMLDDNARLRVGLQVSPHKTVMAAKARAEREQEMMAEFEKFVEEITLVPLDLSDDNANSLYEDKGVTLFGGNENTLPGSPFDSSRYEPSGVKEWESRMVVQPLSPVSGRPQNNFFCGAAMCNDRGNVENGRDFIFSDLTQHTRSAVCHRRELSFRESSVMSSISESTDESDFTDVGGFLTHQVLVLKHRQGV